MCCHRMNMFPDGHSAPPPHPPPSNPSLPLQGKALGVGIGCILGMFPLLFFKDDDDKKEGQSSGEATEKTASTAAAPAPASENWSPSFSCRRPKSQRKHFYLKEKQVCEEDFTHRSIVEPEVKHTDQTRPPSLPLSLSLTLTLFLRLSLSWRDATLIGLLLPSTSPRSSVTLTSSLATSPWKLLRWKSKACQPSSERTDVSSASVPPPREEVSQTSAEWSVLPGDACWEPDDLHLETVWRWWIFQCELSWVVAFLVLSLLPAAHVLEVPPHFHSSSFTYETDLRSKSKTFEQLLLFGSDPVND